MANISEDHSIPSPLDQTQSNLKLLGLFYIIMGFMALPTLLVFAFHGPILDQIIASTPDPEMREAIERIVNVSFAGIALLIIAHIVACIYIGLCFRKQQHHTLCIVAAVFCCLSFPLGTILGVFSLIVLMKPEAKQLFGIAPAIE